MAVWEVRAVDQVGERFWENVWHVDVGVLTDVPSGLVTAFTDFAVNTLLSIYSVARVVRRPAGTTDAFIEVIVDVAGANPIGGDFALPLYNVMKIALAGGTGRPGAKLLRGLLVAGDITDELNHINAAKVTGIQTAADALFNAASDAACSIVFGSTDRVAVSPIVDNLVHMRQLHRKRRHTP